MSASNVIQLIKDNDVQFVDLRFADMLGKQHHVTFPPIDLGFPEAARRVL